LSQEHAIFVRVLGLLTYELVAPVAVIRKIPAIGHSVNAFFSNIVGNTVLSKLHKVTILYIFHVEILQKQFAKLYKNKESIQSKLTSTYKNVVSSIDKPSYDAEAQRHVINFSNADEMHNFFHHLKPAKPQARTPIQHMYFLDMHGPRLYEMYETMKEEFTPYGLLDKSTYHGFLDAVIPCISMTISVYDQSIYEEDEIIYI
jgi:hypothetical protein